MNKTHRILAASLISLALAVVGLTAVAGEVSGTYGAGLGEATPVAVVDLLKTPEKYVGKAIRVEGRVDAVCPMAGCWIDIAGSDAESTVRFKVKDGEIVFPTEAKDHNVVAEGIFTKSEMTREQALEYAKHIAEELGRDFDPEKEEISTVVYRIDGTGAVIE